MIDLEIFRTREPGPIGTYRRNAVMLLVQETEEGLFLILEKRALSLRSQPGDISLPGGRVEMGETPAETALRETCEELGLKEEDLEMIGPMDFFISSFQTILSPFVGRTSAREFIPNPPEVAEVIRVPLNWILHEVPEIYPVKLRAFPEEGFPFEKIQGGRNYKFSEPEIPEYFYHFGPHHIWGMTARIIYEFLQILKQTELPEEK